MKLNEPASDYRSSVASTKANTSRTTAMPAKYSANPLAMLIPLSQK